VSNSDTAVRSTFASSLATRGALAKHWFPVALFGLLWIDLIRLLSYAWSAKEQYAYGWFVPVFVLGFLWRRSWDRPLPELRRVSLAMAGLMAIAAVALLLLRIVYQVNPDWPLVAWLYAILVVGASLYALFLTGGPSWVRHFAFPVAFILVAVVWPWRIEKGLTENLMKVVARVTVELLGWLDIPALHRGNLIELTKGVVGIDEACSGIRSFQSTLMAGLLMGELHRLRVGARAGLVLCGLVLAFVLNICRTLLLSWEVSRHGLSALEKWHDPAGLAITVLCVFGLWLLTAMVKSRSSGTDLSRGENPKMESVAGVAISAGSVTEGAGVTASKSRLPRLYLILVGCWVVIMVLATECWYRAHEVGNAGKFHWAVNLPESNASFRSIELPARTVHLLGYDVAKTGDWLEPDGSQWNAYFFRWQPRSIHSVIISRIHRPDRCLPAAGMEQVADSGIKYFSAGSLQLPFRRYIYQAGGKAVHVYFCQWEDGGITQKGLQNSSEAGRLSSVMAGRRIVGTQTLEFMLRGYTTLEEADRALGERLPKIIHLEDPAGVTAKNAGWWRFKSPLVTPVIDSRA
jgi:exosortase